MSVCSNCPTLQHRMLLNRLVTVSVLTVFSAGVAGKYIKVQYIYIRFYNVKTGVNVPMVGNEDFF